jgi:hypothetical protein
MMEISLQAVANQSFSVTLEGRRYVLTFKEAAGMMAVDVTRDEVELLRGHRVVALSPLLPYRSVQDGGNFVLLTENGELPYYPSFGYTQKLIYLTAAEVAALRG